MAGGNIDPFELIHPYINLPNSNCNSQTLFSKGLPTVTAEREYFVVEEAPIRQCDA